METEQENNPTTIPDETTERIICHLPRCGLKINDKFNAERDAFVKQLAESYGRMKSILEGPGIPPVPKNDRFKLMIENYENGKTTNTLRFGCPFCGRQLTYKIYELTGEVVK